MNDETLLIDLIENNYLTVEEKTEQTALYHIFLIKDMTGIETSFTGSRAICPTHCTEQSDWDYLGLVPFLTDLELNKQLKELWWINGGGSADRKGFKSCKLKQGGNINLILTNQKKFFDKFLLATELAKKENLFKKEERIRFFSKIMDEEVNETRITFLPADQRISQE